MVEPSYLLGPHLRNRFNDAACWHTACEVASLAYTDLMMLFRIG